jgi:hypothetical protein
MKKEELNERILIFLFHFVREYFCVCVNVALYVWYTERELFLPPFHPGEREREREKSALIYEWQ